MKLLVIAEVSQPDTLEPTAGRPTRSACARCTQGDGEFGVLLMDADAAMFQQKQLAKS